MILAVISLIAALAVAPTQQAEVRNARIYAPKLTVSRPRINSDATVGGQIRVDMSFAKAMAKKPILKLVCLCDAGGTLSVHTIFLDRTRTCDGLKRSEIMSALKDAGIDVAFKEREKLYADPSKFTPYLSEVSKEAFAAAVYGTADMNRGYFRLGRSEVMPKVLLYRIELWQNGVMVSGLDSSRTGLGKYDIPADWHQWKKYPQKFKYADIR